MIVVGVDPGISGAWAVLRTGHVQTFNFPVWKPFGKNKIIDVPELLCEIETWRGASRDDPWNIWIELGQSMPNQSSAAGFNYGRACGAIETSFFSAFPRSVVHYVRPSVWKRSLGLLKQDKNVSLDKARLLFPQNRDQFKLKKDHNKAEAALIAWYGAKVLTEGK